MKKLLTVLALLIVTIGISAQTTVDSNGQATIMYSKGDKLSKLMKGVNKKDLRSLVIKDNPSNPGSQRDYEFVNFKNDLCEFLQKNPQIESLNLMDCKGLSEVYLDNEFIGEGSKRKPITSIKQVIVGGKEYDKSKDFIDNSLTCCSEFISKPIIRESFPNVEEFVVKVDRKENEQYFNDNLPVNWVSSDGFYPTLDGKKRLVIWKKYAKDASPRFKIYEKGGIAPDLNNLDGVVYLNGIFLRNYKAETLTIPSSVIYVVGNFDKNETPAIVDNLGFAESNYPIYFSSNNAIKVNKSITCNRPISTNSNIFKGVPDVTFGYVTKIFGGTDFKNCQSITFNGNTTITGGDFNGVRLITFNNNVSIDYSGFPNSLREGDIIFNGEASIKGHFCWGVRMMMFRKKTELASKFAEPKFLYVPKGTTVPSFEDKSSSYIFEYDPNAKRLSKNIQLDKPNSLLSVITIDELMACDSLTITGFLYENDASIISDNTPLLKYLDISNTVITYSPQANKKAEEDAAFVSAIFNLIGAAADLQYANNETSTMDYLYTKGVAGMIANSQNISSGIEQCCIPNVFMSGHYFLQEVRLPITATTIYRNCFGNCPNLEIVQYPKFLKQIGEACFNHCISLKEIKLPSTMTTIKEAYYGCSGLETVDFSNLTLSDFQGFTFHSKPLKVYKFPKLKNTNYNNRLERGYEGRVETVYIPNDCGVIAASLENCNVHLESPTIPKFGYHCGFENCTIYCPKGSATEYYARFGKDNKIIEE